MARYYYGDIEGQFMRDQSSDAASQFGGELESNCIFYEYESEKDFDMNALEELIADFNEEEGTSHTLDGLLFNILRIQDYEPTSEYTMTLKADIVLGVEILKYIRTKGSCKFKAELW